jgi:hypothetical protein
MEVYMSKYDQLGTFLRNQKTQEIPMTFTEIERVVGGPLPRSSRYPAWWSNNPSNNVMTRIWLDAGFKTEQVDTATRKLVFRRTGNNPPSHTPPTGMSEPARPFVRGRHPLLGALKGIVRIPGKTDLTKPADPDWGDK